MMKGSSQAIIYSSFGNSVGQAIASTAEGEAKLFMRSVLDIPLPIDAQLHRDLAARFPTVESFLTSRAAPYHHTGQEETQEAVAALTKHVQQSIAPKIQSGRELLEQFQRTRLLPTGCRSIDEILLRGGVREEHHVELVGECGSGKTQLCMQMAAFTALRRERVAYVDTAGSFSWGSFAAMYEALPKQSASLAEARAHLDLYRVFTLRDLLQLLHALSQALAEGAGQTSGRPSLLVVDSLSFLVSPVMGPGGADDGHALMICLGRALKALAQRRTLAVITTNHIVGGSEEVKAALGESWKVQANMRIMLSCMGPALRKATMAANTLGPCGTAAFYELSEGGPIAVDAPE